MTITAQVAEQITADIKKFGDDVKALNDNTHRTLAEMRAEIDDITAQIIAGDPDARLGLDTRSSLPDADLRIVGKQAGVLARGAMPGEVCAPWPQAAAFDLVAPQFRFETGGEIVTALGDIPVGRFLRHETA